jgi:xanthine dehydrogenase molybdenum-binding subunit
MTTTYERNVVLATKTFDVVGTRPIRHDGHEKVTGKAVYGADFTTTRMLYGKVLRSPHAHARIKSIDTSKADALPGVMATVTAADLPKGEPGEIFHNSTQGDLNLQQVRDAILAGEKVLYKGHPVAGVAATSPHIAEEALDLIEVDYAVLPAVSTAPEAMAQGAPVLLDYFDPKDAPDFYDPDEGTDTPTNVTLHVQYKNGDLEKGFEEADVIVEREFDTATVHQGYIEPHNCTVNWGKDGRVYIWNSTQAPFEVRDITAAILGVPLSMVKLTPLEIGGAFGGKWEPYGEPIAALLSKKTDHSVKIIMSRAEEFEATGPTPGSHMKVKIGSTKDGKFVAAQAFVAFESGGWPGSPIEPGCQCVFAVYDIPNILVDGYDVVVNKPKSAAYRAPGSTHVAYATESVVDELAEKLGIDPLELRLMNAAKEGTRRADGPRFARIGCVEVIEAMKDHPHYKAPLEGPNRGRGVSVGFWFNAGMPSSCSISVNSDGTISLVEGSTDIGGSRTSIAMQAAEVLGIPAEDVHPATADTDSVGFTAGTGGSRVTFATGWAAHEAAQEVKGKMLDRAALVWDVDSDSLQMEKGVISSKDDPELNMSFKELCAQLENTGGPIMGSGTVDPKGEGGSYAGNVVDVEVDPETGKVTILRFTVVQDAGKAIHPSYVEGQLQGGSAQGIGWALNEEYFMDDAGRMSNNTLLDYRMPVALDLPMIDTVIVEVANPSHPFGVRGVGEANIVPPPAALANAIHAATGVRMARLPMNPPSITKALWEKSK